MILEKFPDVSVFYRDYWGKKPFIVKGYIAPDMIEQFIDGDTLAGLSLEEDIKSRIITNNAAGNEWACEHGPFDEDRYDDIGDQNWSLLVQNVEQFHPETAELLGQFQFSPRWLIDDIMVSFSATGGSVGPHIDSYHTFLVQGMGKRAWKIGNEIITEEELAENSDMKVLKHGFEGEIYEVSVGDVIYMPPFFGHEGKTIDPAMTFSVGFLGPKMSEILGEYAQYLEQNDNLNNRFLGENLNEDSAGFNIGSAQNYITNNVVSSLQSEDFSRWMAGYFATPTHDSYSGENTQLDKEGIIEFMREGGELIRPEEVKIAMTRASSNDYYLAVYEHGVTIQSDFEGLIKKMNLNEAIRFADIEQSNNCEQAAKILTILCDLGALKTKEL